MTTLYHIAKGWFPERHVKAHNSGMQKTYLDAIILRGRLLFILPKSFDSEILINKTEITEGFFF